jgi:hypothetical protein
MITRTQFVAEAESWIPTPYLKQSVGQVKHAGANCATFVYAVLVSTGMIQAEEVGVFSPDWACHTSEEIYMKRLLRHAPKVAEAISRPGFHGLPGNIVLVKTPTARLYNHGGIVVHWPTVIHCAPDSGVCKVNATTHWLWANRKMCSFDPWAGEHGLS